MKQCYLCGSDATERVVAHFGGKTRTRYYCARCVAAIKRNDPLAPGIGAGGWPARMIRAEHE